VGPTICHIGPRIGRIVLTNAGFPCLASLYYGRGFLVGRREDVVTAVGPSALNWRHSSFCNGGDCVEIAASEGLVAIRSSGTPDGQALTFPARSWQQFIEEVKRGELNYFGRPEGSL
jgi:hypothetical protein